MTFDSFQRFYKEYPDLRTFLDEQWHTKEGHPCTAFSFYFWNEYEKYKKMENFPRLKDIEVKEVTKKDKKKVSDNTSDFSSSRELKPSNNVDKTSGINKKSNNLSSNQDSNKDSNIPKDLDSKIDQKNAFSFKKLLYFLEDKSIIKYSILILLASFIFFNLKLYQFFSFSYIYNIPRLLDELISTFLFSIILVDLSKGFSRRMAQIIKSKENGMYILIGILFYSIIFFTFLSYIGNTYVFIKPEFDILDLLIFIAILIFVSYLLNEYRVKNILLVITLLVLLANITTNYSRIYIINSIISIFSPGYTSNESIYPPINNSSSSINESLNGSSILNNLINNLVTEEYPHIIPDYSYNGSFLLNFSFLLGSKIYSINLSIPEAIYYGAKNGFKSYEYYCYIPICEPPEDWVDKYYRAFIFDPNEKDIFLDIIKQIDSYTNDTNKFVDIATAFVQSIPYDYEKFYLIEENISENIRFPVEVLVDDKGICSEKSLLLAGILAYAGYDVVLFDFENESHMAVGIRCSCNNSFRGSGYCFIETTSLTPIGYVPEEYMGGIKLVSTPRIIRVGSGEKIYANCFYIDNNLTDYKYEIIEKFREYLESNYGLIYREDLTKSINSQYLPYGYTSGVTWTIPIENGDPDFIIAEIIECNINGKCSQNITSSESLKSDLETYRYYGIDIVEENNTYYLVLLLAK